jgi:hypothetical protein
MFNFESQPNEHGITLDNQAHTKAGREKQYAEIIERRKDGAERALSKLLVFLTEKLGKEVTLAELSSEFGQLGAEVESSFQAVMSEGEEGESINKTAHFVSAVSKVRSLFDGQH